MKIRMAVGALLLLGISSVGLFGERRDVKEPKAALIPEILRETKIVQVSCGDDAERQTCKFFVNALSGALRNQRIKVLLYYDADRTFMGLQSFYVPPRMFESLNVTLRLIEDGPPESTRLYLGGCSFDPDGTPGECIQLPRWNQLEGGKDTGPMEADRALAARKLAKEFAAYWIDAITPKNPKTP